MLWMSILCVCTYDVVGRGQINLKLTILDSHADTQDGKEGAKIEHPGGVIRAYVTTYTVCLV